MIISFAATNEEVQKIDMLRTAMRHSTRSDVLRHILADAHDKIFAQNLPTGNTYQQPAPSAPSAPAAPPAWVCPSPEEIRRLEPYQALTLIMEHWDEMDNECQQAAADTQEVTYEQAEELAHCND